MIEWQQDNVGWKRQCKDFLTVYLPSSILLILTEKQKQLLKGASAEIMINSVAVSQNADFFFHYSQKHLEKTKLQIYKF